MTIETLPAQFEGQNLDIYNIHGERWTRADQIGLALELAFPSRAIRKIHERHADEFGPDDTMIVDLPTDGGVQSFRVFSHKGAMKIGFFTRSPKAAAFRDWAARVLTAPPAPAAPQMPGAVQKELAGFWLKHAANRKLVKYAQMDLNNSEIALLCGWKTRGTVQAKRRTAEALGLIAPPANLPQLQAKAAHLIGTGAGQ